jgi:hypothetical protein
LIEHVQFCENTGIKVQVANNASISDYFNMFVDSEDFEDMATETNRCPIANMRARYRFSSCCANPLPKSRTSTKVGIFLKILLCISVGFHGHILKIFTINKNIEVVNETVSCPYICNGTCISI